MGGLTFGTAFTHSVPVVKTFLEIKVRPDTPQQKKDFEAAADAHRPRLSLNQWLLLAAIEKLARDKADEASAALGIFDKKKGR